MGLADRYNDLLKIMNSGSQRHLHRSESFHATVILPQKPHGASNAVTDITSCIFVLFVLLNSVNAYIVYIFKMKVLCLVVDLG